MRNKKWYIAGIFLVLFLVFIGLSFTKEKKEAEEELAEEELAKVWYYKDKIVFQGEEMSYKEAFPKLKEAIGSADMKIRIEAVKQLGFYGDSLEGTDIVEKLIQLYHKYPSPPDPRKKELTLEEGFILELKGEILSAVGVSEDKRGRKLLEEASRDSNEAIQWLARKIKNDLKKYRMKKGGVFVERDTGKVVTDPRNIGQDIERDKRE